MGFSFKGIDSFSAIPGLKTWLDARYGITLNPSNSNEILSWFDLSSNRNDFFTITAFNTKPRKTGSNFINFAYTANTKQIRSNKKDFNFLHNGSAFGIYWIYNVTNADDGYNILTTSSGSNDVGFRLERQGLTFPRWRIRAFDGTTSLYSLFFGSGVSPSGRNETTDYWSVVFEGESLTNGLKLRKANTILSQINTPTINNPAGHNTFKINGTQSQSTLGVEGLNLGMLIIYDWTGYDSTTVQAYDLRVRNLLAQTLPLFT